MLDTGQRGLRMGRWGPRRRREPGAPAARRSLFRRYVLICAVLVGAMLLASGLVQLWFTYQQTTTSQGRIEQEQAATAAATIIQFFTQIEPQIRLVNQSLQAGGNVSDDQRRAQYDILVDQVQSISALRYLDASGRERVFVSRLARAVIGSSANFAGNPTVAESRRTGKIAYSPVQFRNESEPYMTMVIPERGVGTGATLAEVNLKFVRDVVTRLTTGQAGYAYVVDGQGRLIAHRDISLVLQNNDLSVLPQVEAARAQAARSPTGSALIGANREDAVIGRDLQGREVLSAHQRIDPPGWIVFVDEPLSEAYAPVYASIVRTAVLLCAGLALAVLASLELARRMVTPIRAVQAGAARIGAGDLDQRIDVRTGDELQALGEEFNRMATRLRESYAGLEHRVEERTRELAEALERETATSAVLRIVSNSATDAQPVLDALVERAALLTDGQGALIHMLDGDTFRTAASFNPPAHWQAGMRLGGDTLSVAAETLRERRTIQLFGGPDGVARDYPRFADTWRKSDIGSALSVPLLRDGVGIGVLAVARQTADPFTPQQISLLETFAAQAVIAIENARLFEEIQAKSRELEEVNHNLEAANRAKSDFLSRMSHELRTPLNAILGFAEIMEMDPQTPATQQEWIQHVLKAGRHLLGLINEVLDIARIEAGRLSLSLEPVAVAAVVNEALDLVRSLAARNAVGIHVEMPAGIDAWVRADRQRLQQVLLNLLTNAIKYNQAGGTVTLRVTEGNGERGAGSAEGNRSGAYQPETSVLGGEDPPVSPLFHRGDQDGDTEQAAGRSPLRSRGDTGGSSQSGHGSGSAASDVQADLSLAPRSPLPATPSLRLTVVDTGPGIPADKLGRLFTPFDRLGAEESGIEGNGLGLAIAQRLVTAMAGELGVDSVVGEGSAFWVELPRAAAPAIPLGPEPSVAPASAANGAAPAGATVLYIEDNLSNIEVMKAVFRFRPGVTLLSAMQGTLGLTLAREHRPDLILLDLNLPDMHGDEVLARLRQDECTRAVPVAVISADATPTQQQRTLAAGALAYLTKPLDVKQLLDLLEDILVREGTSP